MINNILFIIPVLVLSFSGKPEAETSSQQIPPSKIIEIAPPSGYTTDTFDSSTFASFVQHLPLKKGSDIAGFNGETVFNPMYNILAVVNLPLLFKQDLEQCADFAMRIRAEYCKQSNRMDSLYLFDYSGKKLFFASSQKSYRQFLKNVFSNANSHSIKRGCKEIKENQLQPGDLIVQNDNGGIGHVSMVVNSSTNKSGEKLFLIGFSFMPAQQFHIEDAMEYGTGGWFTLAGYVEFLKSNLDLGEPVLRRF